MHKKKKESDAQIKEFVDTHIIPPEVAKDYIHHLWQLNIMKAMRAKEKSVCVGGGGEKKRKGGSMMSTPGESCVLLMAWISFWLRI